jgi:hypothetical protein
MFKVNCALIFAALTLFVMTFASLGICIYAYAESDQNQAELKPCGPASLLLAQNSLEATPSAETNTVSAGESAATSTTGSKVEKTDTLQIRRPPNYAIVGCNRPFLFKEQLYPTDSPQSQDANTLRKVVQTVPSADALLGQYQSNRRKSEISAYSGTIGLLTFVFAHFISIQFKPNDNESLKSILRLGGLSLAAGGFLYSFTLLRTNELLIPRAVNEYNQQNPKQPISLQFSAGFGF